MITQEVFFSIITDENGNILSKEELKDMQLEGLISLLNKKIRTIKYLQDEDKRMFLNLVHLIKGISEF